MWPLLLSWCGAALADPGASAVQVADDNGTVVAFAVVPASDASIRQLLADTGGGLKDLFPDVLNVAVAPDGACQDVRRQTRGPFSPLELHVRRCPTAGGFREDLVAEGSSFQAYTSEWRLTPAPDGGTRVEYRVALSLKLPVPAFALAAGVESASKQAVERLIARFTRRSDER